ncbi:hypothetical protein SCLARK_001287 [Spiroplasma clarkii]|uniref:Uncharacterized protein n=1 Tax=Spiroplasma clarkii TaxID=2139 RepID=A0A1Y0L1G3_9MOLU|nr:hypothetical protein [Spiroplasma clarkii]ARU91827.1 hypothetical protein SCLARK_001287 [Spiroplasma clarkii]ATX71189.1 hypothetical protein SCLAR_v1c08810 [Spiroplasma clarkii]
MKNAISFASFFEQFKDTLPINRINEKINDLIINKKIIVLDENYITDENTNKFDFLLGSIEEFVNEIIECCRFAAIVDSKLLISHGVDKFALVYYLQRHDFDFEIYGIISSKGFKIKIWKNSKISLDEIIFLLQSQGTRNIDTILSTEYFVVKSDFLQYRERRNENGK